MAGSRISRRTLVLAAVTVAAAVVLVAIWPAGTADTTGSSPNGRPPQGTGVPPQTVDPAVPPALGLERMDAERPVPANRRDLFRFGAETPEPVAGPDSTAAPAPGRGRRGAPPAPVQAEPSEPVPQPPPPIPLRFIGLVRTQDGAQVASFSDGRATYYGKEGQVIEGRWRVVKIGAESVVIERVDGTGRQTLRLPG